jgi:hypothetical protein
MGDAGSWRGIARVFQTSVTMTAIRSAELLKLSAFQVQDGYVVWRHDGAIYKEGPLARTR